MTEQDRSGARGGDVTTSLCRLIAPALVALGLAVGLSKGHQSADKPLKPASSPVETNQEERGLQDLQVPQQNFR
jgi:hypothetical protein